MISKNPANGHFRGDENATGSSLGGGAEEEFHKLKNLWTRINIHPSASALDTDMIMALPSVWLLDVLLSVPLRTADYVFPSHYLTMSHADLI